MQVVEEFMSIADGQLVLQATPSTQSALASRQGLTGSNVDVSTSVSRIGCRAYPAAMAGLAPSIRFDLAQAADALKFTSSKVPTELQQQQLQRAGLLQAALAQQPRHPVPVEEQVLLSLRGDRTCFTGCMATLPNVMFLSLAQQGSLSRKLLLYFQVNHQSTITEQEPQPLHFTSFVLLGCSSGKDNLWLSLFGTNATVPCQSHVVSTGGWCYLDG